MGIIALGIATLRPLSICFSKYWTNHQILSYNLAAHRDKNASPVPYISLY